MTGEVVLRIVRKEDAGIFYEHQREAESNEMAAFPAAEEQAFLAKWERILADETTTKRTIVSSEQVAGYLVSWQMDGVREVGYWIGKEFWGKGVASQALAEFLGLIVERPLYAHVAKHNVASRRVLEKCGFIMVGEDPEFSRMNGEMVAGYVLRLG